MTPAEASPARRPYPPMLSRDAAHSDVSEPADRAWDCLAEREQLGTQTAKVEELPNHLGVVCADIVKNGSNAEKACYARMLEAGLIEAQRQTVLAQQQLDAALRGPEGETQ